MDEIEELQALDRAWRRAIVANEAGEIGRFMSEDWVLVDGDGVGTREKFLSLVSSGALTHSRMEAVPGTERVRVYGDTAVVTARVVNTAHYGGRDFHADEWTTDVYRQTDQGWVCVISQATPAQG
ncbi:nuclear transport factor 2 family protein [Nocardiopsis sp. HNM0947]|uniref:Nuclear transport factor 2 family protein n=1 Tax=Nocardiopsis coralli TaxID=2772213 RepID=A0ABR9PBV7_9ACTN|nr:nuclear transport factor 2 family protein [Nocardiopsis coralli]MBE3001327.1 nuclear transport factor 2 family protein [Nocardiopsis coralli]